MSTYTVSNTTPVPTATGAYQSDGDTQFSSAFQCILNKEWTDFQIWWDEDKKWPKIISQNSLDCNLLFTGTSVPNAIINNNDNLSPYTNQTTNNDPGTEFWFNSNLKMAPTYTPVVNSVISAKTSLQIDYFDDKANLLRGYSIEMYLHFITQNPAFPVNVQSTLKFNVTCWGL